MGLLLANTYFTYSEFNDLNRMSKFRAYNEMIKTNENLLPWTGVFKPSVEPKVRELDLSNKSDNELLFCNEAGEGITYYSDRYGFNNENDVYEEQSPNLFFGDSFLHQSR